MPSEIPVVANSEIAKSAAIVASPEPQAVVGLKLRKPTAGTALIMERVGSKIWNGVEVSDTELIYEAAVYLFIHSQPIAKVNAAACGDFRSAVTEFADSLPMEHFGELLDAIKTNVEESAVGADFKVKPQNGAPAPKN